MQLSVSQDNFDINRLIFDLDYNHPTNLISWKSIKKALRKQNNKDACPKQIKSILASIDMCEWVNHGGVPCIRWTISGLDYKYRLEIHEYSLEKHKT